MTASKFYTKEAQEEQRDSLGLKSCLTSPCFYADHVHGVKV